MNTRLIAYAAAVVAIVAVVYAINRPGPPRSEVVLDVDPAVATGRGSHDHEKLGTACLCDPEAEIKQALKDRAGFSEAHRELGDRFYARGQYEHALTRYQRAVELDALNSPAHYGLGLVHTKLGQFDKAEQSIKEAAELDPTLVDAQISLGVLAYRAGRFEAAGKHWETALRLDSGNDYAKELLARLPRLRRLTHS